MATQLESTAINTIAQSIPGNNAQAFFKRVWSTPPAVYENRLKALGLTGLTHVLDCGCGFGQWTLPLAQLNGRVTAVDISEDRINAARQVAQAQGLNTIDWHAEDLNAWVSPPQSVSAIFAYSTLYYTDFIRFFQKAYQWLEPGGLFYLNTNDLGYSLNNLFQGQHQVQDYSPRAQAIESLDYALRYYSLDIFEPGKCLIMPQEKVLHELKRSGFNILACGPDGSINRHGIEDIQAFFPPDFENICSVYEVLCQKTN